jgi:hypothetical protein
MVNVFSLIVALFAFINPTSPSRTLDHAYQVSLVREGEPGQATNHGWDKVKAALFAKGIQYEEVSDPKTAHSGLLIAAGLWSDSASGSVPERIRALGVKMPSKPESLVIHKGEWQGKQALLLSGSDDRGLMYALLEVAKRIGWAKDKALPLSEVRDTVESPDVADRGVIIFTMQKHQYEDRLHDENYWAQYFDMLAENRFNTIKVKFALEANGYNCPVYPYYMDVNGFPNVKVTGLSKEEQQRNLADLHRFVRLAHERGISVMFGIWCHYYRFTATWAPVDYSIAAPYTVSGLTEANLIPYTIAAIGQFLKEFHEIDKVQLLMMDESGLKTSDMKEFWKNIYPALKEAAPNLQYELRAKGVSDDLVKQGIDLGLKIQMNTKIWTEQVGLPFLQTHVQEVDQFNRRGSYADMFKYPRAYKVHWTLWTGGTIRILLWGDPEYVRRFAASTHLGGVEGFDIDEPLASKMHGQPHDLKPFELLSPSYRYYDYEFQRYWYFFQLFGRLTYNPNTPAEELDHEFVARFGKDAAPFIKQGLQRASQILPQITAYCEPAEHYSIAQGWPERQRQDDLPDYVKATPTDTQQFENLKDAADDIIEGRSSPKMTPTESSQWFAHASSDVRRLIAQAEQHTGPHPGKEFTSTIVDLKILSGLAAYHSRRVLAGLSYALFEKTRDLNALDDAIQHEQEATDAWAGIVRDAGDVYNFNLAMGVFEADMTGHWRDDLVKLTDGLAALKKQREQHHLEVRREIGKYDLGTGPVQPGYQRVTATERAGSHLVTLNVPDGRYEVTVGIHDDKASHGPMWIDVNGVEYSDVFSVPAGQTVTRTIETTAVDGRLKVLLDHATSTDAYASTLVVTRISPAIAHVPVRRLAPGQDLKLRATVAGIAPSDAVRVYYGDAHRGFTMAELQGTGPLYQATIPASKLTAGVSYFLQAIDSSGRISTFPEDGSLQPIQVMVTSDDQPPTLHHAPILSAEPLKPLRITARVEDPSGVKWLHLRYRGLSQFQDFQVLNMLPTGNSNEYEATIPAKDLDPQFDLMYLFEAMDNAGNGKIYPDMAKETPYIIVNVGHSQLQATGGVSLNPVKVTPGPGTKQ